LSYTRIGDDLTRQAGGLNRPGNRQESTGKAPEYGPAAWQTALFPRKFPPIRPLNSGRFAAYTVISINNERR